MKTNNIEDIYGLSPMQEGILFEELYAPEESRFVTQCVTTLRGKLDRSALFHACQDVIACHTVLRTSFHWQNLDRPLQVVHRQVELPITEEDCQGLTAQEQEKRLQTFLEADRRQNFDISRPPLIRLRLIRCAEQIYQLISSHHHLLLDGWSLSLLLNEILNSYEARCCGTEIQFRSRPFRDYIKWLEEQDLKQSEPYWRATLKGFTSPTPLAIDHPRRHHNRGHSFGQGLQEAQLSEATTYALQQLARQHQLTLHTVVAGAWALLLSRYSRSQDVVVGVTVSVRPVELPTIEQMIGLFINTLPTLVQVRGETPVLNWLQDVQRRMSEMRRYEHTPLARIQTWSEVERGQPLFKSIVVFQNYPVKPYTEQPSEFNSGLEIVRTQTFEQADYWLTLTVAPGRNLKFSLGYRLSLGFDNAAVKRMLAHLQTILEAIVKNPEQTLDKISLLTRTERRQLLAAGSNYVREPQQNLCLHQLFEEQAKRTPDALAISLEDEQLVYERLNQSADQVATYLQKLGVRPEMKIGICLERSVEMVVALLGVLKAGGAYVPLDATYPPERLSFILKDADIEVLLTQSPLVERLPPTTAQIVCLNSEWKEIEQQSLEKPQRLACPENLACVIYTSGSTGKPKGVLHSHQSIVDYTSHIIKDFQLAATDRVLQFASLSFDVAVEEIFPTLSSGATLVLTPTVLAAKNFLNFIVQEQLTIFELPTAFWHEWMREMSIAGTRLPECVRMVIVGGEEILPERFANWQQLAGHQASLVHVFGLTETAVTSTTYHVKPHEAVQRENEDAVQERGAVLPIGRPLPNTEVYVLDERFEPVPIGIVGELHIGGSGLARGYLNQTELTADKFIPHPFSDREGARLYRTGDFVRYLAEGNLEFVGRIDNQVKVRGFRIELGEIEAVLREHPSVSDAVVVVKESATSDQQLVAYLISGRDEKLNAGEIRLFLREKVPSHMLPNAYVQLQNLPLTTNGKVDRHALPAPGNIQMASHSPFIAPQSKLEQEIAALWQEVLQQEKVGRHDNFFELGGHSLLMMRVYGKLRDKTTKEFSLIEMFNHPTVHALARFIAREYDEEEDFPQDAARLAKLADGNDRLRRQFKRLRATES